MGSSVMTRSTGVLLAAGLLMVGGIDPASAQPYESGHRALEIWDAEGQANAPLWVRIWLNIMLLTFALGLIFVWWRVEARWAVGGMLAVIASVIFIQTMTEIVLLSGLLALLHVVFWSPALYLLVTRRPFMKERSAYAVWSGAMTFVIAFSFLFDIRDSLIYLNHILGLGLFS